MSDEASEKTALLSALTTEHFVLQTAYSSTVSEATGRSTLYVMALSSSLVAMGFLSQSQELFRPFVATVVPAVFLLGLFTVVRLVDTGLESMHYLTGIARIRCFYRTLGARAAEHFTPEQGRWPEVESPAERPGALAALLGTTASLFAVINSMVAGATVALLVQAFAPGVAQDRTGRIAARGGSRTRDGRTVGPATRNNVPMIIFRGVRKRFCASATPRSETDGQEKS